MNLPTGMNSERFFTNNRRQRLGWGFVLGASVAAGVLLVWALNLFTQMRLRVSDILFSAAPVSETIVIIALDDDSLNTYGRAPSTWPRSLYADLIERLSEGSPRVIAFDLLFSEETEEDPAVAAAIENARSGAARTRFVMPAIGVGEITNQEAESPHLHYETILPPTMLFRESVDYLGYINTFADVDGTIRRQPSQIQYREQRGVSYSLAVYLAYLRIPESAVEQLVRVEGDRLFVTPQRALPIDERGIWRQNFFGPPHTSGQGPFPVYSLGSVLNNKVDPAVFADKIVLIGLMNSFGLADRYPVPSGVEGLLMDGVEVHANAIETLIQDAMLRESARADQALLIIVFSLGAGLIYSQLRWYLTIPLSLLLLVGWLAIAIEVFHTQHLLLNLFHSGLALLLPVIVNIGYKAAGEVGRRKRTEFLLTSVVQASEQGMALDKMTAELAEDIQRLFPASRGAVWVPSGDSQPPTLSRDWLTPSPQLEALSKRAAAEQAPLREKDRAVFPAISNGHLLALIGLEARFSGALRRGRLNLLQDLIQNIAPNLENAMLYTEIERQKRLLEAVLAGSPSGIIVVDQEKCVLRANTIFAESIGQPLDAALDQPLLSLLEKSGLAADSLKQLATQLGAAASFQQEITLSGKTFTLEAALLPSVRQWVIVFNDVTTLIELNKLKTRMIRMASHDLKNPLARILGYATLLQEIRRSTPFPEDSGPFLDHITEGAQQMNEIISNILSLEQIRSQGVMQRNFDLRQVTMEVIGQQRADIAAKKQSLVTEIAPEPLVMTGTDIHLSQAVGNLLSNAIKYTPSGGTITVHLQRQGNHRARLEVIDTGLGIPESAQKDLFTEFYRVRTRATAAISGTGLGLSLVKSVIEAHQGRVGFQSKEGAGSTFWIEVPLEQDKPVDGT